MLQPAWHIVGLWNHHEIRVVDIATLTIDSLPLRESAAHIARQIVPSPRVAHGKS